MYHTSTPNSRSPSPTPSSHVNENTSSLSTSKNLKLHTITKAIPRVHSSSSSASWAIESSPKETNFSSSLPLFSQAGYENELEILGRPKELEPLSIPPELPLLEPLSEVMRACSYYSLRPENTKTLLISNKNFDNEFNFPDRSGSETDLKHMQELTAMFNWPLNWAENLSASEMQTAATNFAQDLNKNPGDCDGCVIYISTYFKDGYFYGSDGQGVRALNFLKPILQCPALKEKPKAFIIQACREPANLCNIKDDHTKSAWMAISTSEYKNQSAFLNEIPNCEDAIFLHSTTPIYYSSGPEGKTGSHFIHSICETLSEKAHEENADVFSLGININRLFRETFGKNSPLIGMNTSAIDMHKTLRFNFTDNDNAEI